MGLLVKLSENRFKEGVNDLANRGKVLCDLSNFELLKPSLDLTLLSWGTHAALDTGHERFDLPDTSSQVFLRPAYFCHADNNCKRTCLVADAAFIVSMAHRNHFDTAALGIGESVMVKPLNGRLPIVSFKRLSAALHAITDCLLPSLEESALTLILLHYLVIIDLLRGLSVVNTEARNLTMARLLPSPLAGLVVLVKEWWGVELAALLAL